MYSSTVIDAIPTPSPTKTHPTMRTAGLGAAVMITAPTKKRKSTIRIAVLLLYRSFSHPPMAAPMIAPATAMMTMPS
ncbi:inositol transporter 2 [Actinidia rufa]|uniref:Inositol transporter 2 n=1 Tax=Actinidia rufa TaxID=165716 RepID=A0A7J0GUB3_9ERIC|nr:inositol transporter 2 [Actinidia rufa]